MSWLRVGRARAIQKLADRVKDLSLASKNNGNAHIGFKQEGRTTRIGFWNLGEFEE